ncbi:hypothetical protein BUMB_01662c [Candidatus Paraburkholderia calva]|nr:hypothetical protein BUMB_01662c [Candidatus Paraburkholderia calva]
MHEPLRVSDVVFIRVTARPFLEVARATRSWTNHVGVVDVSEDDALVAENTFPFSRITLFSRFVARSEQGAFAVARLDTPLTLLQQRRVFTAQRRRLRVFYDTGFDLRSRRQFCSRFVREVLIEATGIEVGEVESFRDFVPAQSRAFVGFLAMLVLRTCSLAASDGHAGEPAGKPASACHIRGPESGRAADPRTVLTIWIEYTGLCEGRMLSSRARNPNHARQRAFLSRIGDLFRELRHRRGGRLAARRSVPLVRFLER